MNKLTEKLLAEGYTKENYPDYVEWSNWRDFEYTRAYLLNSVWETPCGLLKKGTGYNHGSHMGVDYCPENDNPRFGCPYYDEKPCSYRLDTIKLWGWNCIYHQTDRPYDYEQSVEKIWDEWDRIEKEARDKAMQDGYCSCLEWNRPKREYVAKYDVNKCIRFGQNGCQNTVCVITKKTRNLEKFNIFYDVLREWHYKKGLLEFTDRKIEKGVKVFDKPVARTDAEIWLKMNKDNIFRPKRDDHRDLHFSEHHGKTGFGEYSFFEFTVTAQNIRIERREHRDLLQDLSDAQEGLKVIHASDTVKAAAQAKKERRKQYKETKNRRREQKNIAKWKMLLTDEESAKSYAEEHDVQIDRMREWAEKELAKRGIVIEKKKEQMSLFG